MTFLELFERAADHVRRLGVKVTFKRGKPLAASDIERARAKALIPIPTSMAEFYAEVGDGLEFGWTTKDDNAPFANHEFPKLRDRVFQSFDTLRWRIEWSDDYDFRYTKNPALAKQTALRMRKWMPFHDEGNGDAFCLDTALNPAPVVFNQHDWDGGTGENGRCLADSLLQFYTDWAQVCFQFPRSLWWPTVLKKDGSGVDWTSAEFREPFRLRGGR
jgi:hypothetical protein